MPAAGRAIGEETSTGKSREIRSGGAPLSGKIFYSVYVPISVGVCMQTIEKISLKPIRGSHWVVPPH